MPKTQNMLAYTITGGGVSNINPEIIVGDRTTGTRLSRRATKKDLPDEYYWIAI